MILKERLNLQRTVGVHSRLNFSEINTIEFVRRKRVTFIHKLSCEPVYKS